MNRRPQRHRPHGHETGKSSFRASPQDRESVRRAIDESLYSVRFNAQDMRSVMQAAKAGKKPSKAKKKHSILRPDLIFALSFIVMVALPLSISVIRSRENMTTIVTSPGEQTAAPQHTAQSSADAVTSIPSVSPSFEQDEALNATPSPAASVLIDENEAIRIARECFETQCDTTIFTFEEYIVGTSFDAQSQQYTVTLDSIYKNGCRFTVVLSGKTGNVTQYSTPKLATVPTKLNSDSAEVRAWFSKYGEFLFTWPQDVQAEFSRRYQGGTLRTAKEGEISFDQALKAVRDSVNAELPDRYAAFYPVLYSERASENGRAYYLVYCCTEEVTDAMPQTEPLLVSFDAQTGDVLSIEGALPETLSSVKTIAPAE